MININKLENKAVKSLELAGWNNKRCLDIGNQIKILEEEGYIPFEYANEIIKSFDGLYISAEKEYGVKSYIGDIEFDVLGSGSGEYDRLELIEELAKESLFPLGMVFGQWFLYVGISHNIYMSDGSKLYLLGRDIEEFLNNVIEIGNKPVEILI